jgi:hypothetical protein
VTEPRTGTERIERALALLETEADPSADWEARVLSAIAGERIERELMRLGADVDPPAGWEARVLSAIDPTGSRLPSMGAGTPERPKRRWWQLALPAFAIAVVAFIVCFPPPQPFTLDVKIAHGGAVTLAPASTAAATVGDVANVAVTGGGPHRAVWVYRDDRALVVECPGEARCRDTGAALTVDVTLDAIAVYRLAALTSKSPIPRPRGRYDDDLAAARRAGSESTIRSITVR